MQDFFDFTGKVVLVTGASSGIGRATAELFGQCGSSVAVSYLKNKQGAEDAVTTISANGRDSFLSNQATGSAVAAARETAIAIQSDVTCTDEIRRMVHEVEDSLGPIDILVNNAGSLIERL